MSILSKVRRALRGEVSPGTALLESARRAFVSTRRRDEHVRFQQQGQQPARLTPKFAGLTPSALLAHFRERVKPNFFAGFNIPIQTQQSLVPGESETLLANAERIINTRSWPLLGLTDYTFVDWHRDPLSNYDWPLEFYSKINLLRHDGSDVRLVWELNRLGHLLPLARAYSVSADERFSAEFFRQVTSWDSRNPAGFGVNWNCAMEVALRAQNLLGAFTVFRRAPGFDSEKLAQLLRIFDQHGTFIREHLEFSYLATSNHYLSDVAGLLWLGIMLPELDAAQSWREFGLRELLRELDKQVLNDGADFESSTGYHRFVLELFLYSLQLCSANGIEIEQRYWSKVHLMLKYLRAYLRPDGFAPLIGDSDGGRVLPIGARQGNDHSYLLPIGAVVFNDPQLKIGKAPAPPELFWLLGVEGLEKYQTLPAEAAAGSQQFPDAGLYTLRSGNDYLLLSASDAGVHGRGSHAHNDALSIEVSCCGRAFIVDPGTYVYTANLEERHLFRSTAYHSTVQIDDVEQNQISEASPFVIGNETQPRLLSWFRDELKEKITAEHYGYRRLSRPVTHRRTVTFHKEQRIWLIEDEFQGNGEHRITTRFHFNSGVKVSLVERALVRARDTISGHRLFVSALAAEQPVELIEQFTSVDYGHKSASLSAVWTMQSEVPTAHRWLLIPACAGEDEDTRLSLIELFEA